MTKEIIIDGVDVSKCIQYEHDEVLTCSDYEPCEDNPYCYFKQLKRAEQKLKRIESVATDLLSLTNEYDNCYHKDNCSRCDKVCQYRFVNKILQIIEGEENV